MNPYHEADPWTAEPTGFGHAYMLRKTAFDGVSPYSEAVRWPKEGYVVCPDWEGDDDWLEKQKGDIFRLPPGWGKNDGGLWGYLHGKGKWLQALVIYEWGIYQVCTVRLSEVRHGRGGACRVPRAWVAFTGSQIEVEDFLLRERSTYAREVCRNFIYGIDEARGLPGLKYVMELCS